MLQQRDLSMLHDDVRVVAPLREVDQLVYFSYESIGLYLYIQETYGELHQASLSTSTVPIFTTDFSR